MTKARKRKTPIVSVETASASSSTSLSSRTIIRRFHVLMRQKLQLKKANILSETSLKILQDVDREIAEMGGLERYQRMSAIGQGNDRGGGSEKVLIGWLKDMRKHRDHSSKLKLLEVGALKPDNYQTCSRWIDGTAIDLRSRHPCIVEQDFFKLESHKHTGKWDVISLSLVLNFVPEARDRGCMLRLAHDFLKPGGHLFLVLPLPCVTNSRYLDFPTLKALMDAIGFAEVKDKWRGGHKMAYWLYQKDSPSGRSIFSFQKKTVLRQGDRNNFCILL